VTSGPERSGERLAERAEQAPRERVGQGVDVERDYFFLERGCTRSAAQSSASGAVDEVDSGDPRSLALTATPLLRTWSMTSRSD